MSCGINHQVALRHPRTKFLLTFGPGYKYKDDTILFPCISFCPGFEYKQLGGFRDLNAAKQPCRNIFRDLSAA
jgi:hypothetical protein